jgi:hypothetical protein
MLFEAIHRHPELVSEPAPDLIRGSILPSVLRISKMDAETSSA